MNVILGVFAGIVTGLLSHVLTRGEHAVIGTIVLEYCVFIFSITVLFKALGPNRWKISALDRWLLYFGFSAVYLGIFLAFTYLIPAINAKVPILSTRTILIILQDWLAATLIGYTCQFLVIRAKYWKKAKE